MIEKKEDKYCPICKCLTYSKSKQRRVMCECKFTKTFPSLSKRIEELESVKENEKKFNNTN